MTSSRHLSSHLSSRFSWLTSGSSVATLVLAASLIALPPSRLQAAENVPGGPGMSLQAAPSAAEELSARQQKLDADNKAIDAGMKEARDKANTAMDAAFTGMATGVAAGTTQIGAAAAGTPAAQGQTQQGQSQSASGLSGLATLVTLHDKLSKDSSRELRDQTDRADKQLKQKEAMSLAPEKLSAQKGQREQLEKQILEQTAAIRKSSRDEAQAAQAAIEVRKLEAQKNAEQAKDRGGMAGLGSIFGGPVVGTNAGQPIEGQDKAAGAGRTVVQHISDLQRAKSAEATAVKTEIGILASQHDDLTRKIGELSAAEKKAKGGKADEVKAEMRTLVAERERLNGSVGTLTAELHQIKKAEREAAEGQKKQLDGMSAAVNRQIAEQTAQSKKGTQAERAQAKDDVQQLKQLQEALNAQAASHKNKLSQIAGEQKKIGEQEALQKKVEAGLRANPGRLDQLILPKVGVAGYADVAAGAKAGQRDPADEKLDRALKQIQDKVASKSGGSDTKGNAASRLGETLDQNKQQSSGKAAADALRGAAKPGSDPDQKSGSDKINAAVKAVQEQQRTTKPGSDPDQKSGSDKINAAVKAVQEQQRTTKPGSDPDQKSGSDKINAAVKAVQGQQRTTKPGSDPDQKSGSDKINAAVKAVQEQQRTAKPGSDPDKKSGSRLNEALQSNQSKQLEQNRVATSGAKAADQVKRMEDANRQRIDQIKTKQQAISTQCPNPPCNVMQQRAPSAGTSAMDRLGGGPSPTLAGTKAGYAAKPQANTAANRSANPELNQMRLQNSLQQQNKTMDATSNMQKKQSETSGAIIRNMR